MTERIRKAILDGIEALTAHSSAAAGWADIAFRRKATEKLRAALLHLRSIEREVTAISDDAQAFEWTLGHLPEEALGDLDPTPFLEAGKPPALAWRLAILHAMREEEE